LCIYLIEAGSSKPCEGTPKKRKKKSEVKPDDLRVKSRPAIYALSTGSSRGFRSKLAEAGGNPLDALARQNAKARETLVTKESILAGEKTLKDSRETDEASVHSDSDSSDSSESKIDLPSASAAAAGKNADATSGSGTDCKQNQPSSKRKLLQQKKRRYVLFLGNLPLAASREDVMLHFRKRGVHVPEFRLLTHKDSGKSKGCGFMELDSDSSLHNALKFHRSRLNGKTINVEVTCGGGGKGEKRKKKIQDKNRKLRLKQSIAHPVKRRAPS